MPISILGYSGACRKLADTSGAFLSSNSQYDGCSKIHEWTGIAMQHIHLVMLTDFYQNRLDWKTLNERDFDDGVTSPLVCIKVDVCVRMTVCELELVSCTLCSICLCRALHPLFLVLATVSKEYEHRQLCGTRNAHGRQLFLKMRR